MHSWPETLNTAGPGFVPLPRQLLHKVALQTPFSRHGGDGLTVGLDDLRGLFQPQRFYESMTALGLYLRGDLHDEESRYPGEEDAQTCQDTHEKEESKSCPRPQGTVLRSQEVFWCSMNSMRGAGNPEEKMLANLLRNAYLTENLLENKAATCLSFFRNVTFPTMIFQLGQSYPGNEAVPGQSLACCTAIL